MAIELLVLVPFAATLLFLRSRRKRGTSRDAMQTSMRHADPERLAPLLAYRARFREAGFSPWVSANSPNEESAEVRAFGALIYSSGLYRDFDWPEWMRQHGDRYAAQAALASADFETISRLLSAIVRKSQFVDGQVGDLIESGWMLAALDRLAELTKEVPPGRTPTGAA